MAAATSADLRLRDEGSGRCLDVNQALIASAGTAYELGLQRRRQRALEPSLAVHTRRAVRKDHEV
ncbi:hypothetical protein [Micromonospora sp. KC723]|uniref:hypothetical protein n=1 Tax=Micromonospora sp. KC723 TaxID=2530381 RepID=UPI001FB79B8E|nr:hypothetical protein [Micromonospora sp. KC723]